MSEYLEEKKNDWSPPKIISLVLHINLWLMPLTVHRQNLNLSLVIRSVLLQRVLMITVNAVSIAVGVSSPRLVKHQGSLLLLTEAVILCSARMPCLVPYCCWNTREDYLHLDHSPRVRLDSERPPSMACVSARLYPLSWDSRASGDGLERCFLIWAWRAMTFLWACSAQNVTLKNRHQSSLSVCILAV